MADQEERRHAPDGGHYTYQEFFDFYGREDEWHNAGTAAAEEEVGYDAAAAAAAVAASSSEEESSSGSDTDSEEEERAREEKMMQSRLAKLRDGPWELEVSVLRATGLHEVGSGLSTRSQTNPFVTVLLNKERIAKTKTLRRTTKPEWKFTTGLIRATGPAWLRKSAGHAVSKMDLAAEEERTGRLLLLENRVKEEKDKALRHGNMWDETTSKVLMDAAAAAAAAGAEREALLSESKQGDSSSIDAGFKSDLTATEERSQSAGAASQKQPKHHRHLHGGKWKDAELKLQVFDWDRLAAHRFLGQVVIPGTKLASLIKGVKRMRRRKPKKVKTEGGESNEGDEGDEGGGDQEKKSGSNSDSDGSTSSESSVSSSESESDSDSDDSGSSTESDGSGRSGRSSMSSEPDKPKYLSIIEHHFEEDFTLQERDREQEDPAATQIPADSSAAAAATTATAANTATTTTTDGALPAAAMGTQRELRLRRLRAIQKAESTVVVEGTLSIRVTLRAIGVFDTELISRGQLFMEKKKKMKTLKKIRKKLRKGKPVEHLIAKAVAQEAINSGIGMGTDRRRRAARGASKEREEEEEDPDLKLTPLEELYVAIDRFHVGSITRAELLRSLTQDRAVQKLLMSHHFEQMGFQLLGRPRLFAEAFLIMDYKRTGEIDFRSFSLFAAHMQATDAPNRLLLRMVYDVILADVVETMALKVACGEASRSMSSGESWLLKRDVRDGLTRNRRAVRLLQRTKTMQVLAYDRIFGESLMRLETQRAGYVSYEEFVTWARAIERQREERIALAKVFDAILRVDQLETAGSAEEVKRSLEQEDLVEPDAIVDKRRLVHSMERMTLPRYSEGYALVSGRYKHLFRPLLRPGLYIDALRALPTSRGGELHFEEFACFVIQYCRHDYRSRMVLWNVFDELLGVDVRQISVCGPDALRLP